MTQTEFDRKGWISHFWTKYHIHVASKNVISNSVIFNFIPLFFKNGEQKFVDILKIHFHFSKGG